MEQSNSRWFTKKYFKLLHKANLIIDYSLNNINILLKNNFHFSKILYVPIGFTIYNDVEKYDRKTDVLFYGDDSSPRRRKILEALGKKFKIRIINNKFGKEIQEELKNTKIVVNIHYYENSQIETVRINEALSLGCVVVSEKSQDIDQYEELKDLVDFVECYDIEALIQKIDFLLNNPELIKKRQKNNLQYIKNIRNKFNFYFMRFLFYCRIIDFDTLYEATKKDVNITKNKICLSLPESIHRYGNFKENNIYNFEIFPGLRYHLNWIGCGLSYKYLSKFLLEKDYPYFIICEDDVLFGLNFQNKLEIILKKLSDRNFKWDMFNGFIADISPNMKILDIEDFNGEKFITIDTTVSAVFVIYTKKILNLLKDWDYTNTDFNNTIDRYLEKKKNIKIVTTMPFLVSHNEELNSVLWQKNNGEIYHNMIENSYKIFNQKIEHFKRANKDAIRH